MARHYFAERANLAAENSLGVASPITASGLGRCPSAGRAGAVRHALLVPSGGNVDGRSGDQVLLASPFIVTEPEIETIVETLALAIDDALIEIGAV